MPLTLLTNRDAVVKAMREFDRRGRDAFLKRHGYGRAKYWFVSHEDRLYDSKAIAGVAAGIQSKANPLLASDFSGGEATVVRRLRGMKFDVIDIREGGIPPARRGQRATEPGSWTLVTDPQKSQRAFDRFRRALTRGAASRGARRWWHERLRLRVELGENGRAQLATDERSAGWTVELNEPGLAGDANRLTAAARAPDGRLWLLLQGRLKLKGRREGIIDAIAFAASTGLKPVPVQVASGPNDRVWFTVCRLDGTDEDILVETTRFVAFCRLAREQFGPAPLRPAALAFTQSVLAGPEVMGFLKVRARPPVDEHLIWKAHAEVWDGLAEALRRRRVDLIKLQPAPGFEIDGLVEHPRRPVLIEIKAASSASDIYEGVGQLLLYRRMLGLPKACRLVLLLPQAPSRALEDALDDLGITVSLYARRGTGPGSLTYDDLLLQQCGAPARTKARPTALRRAG